MVVAAAAALVVPARPAAATAVEWLDPTFGTGGTTTFPGEFPATNFDPRMTLPAANGRLYVPTVAWHGFDQLTLLRRLLPDGTVDSSFGTVTLNHNTNGSYMITQMWADPLTGTVTVLGSDSSNPSSLLSRYTIDGQPDPTFGNAGSLTIAGASNTLVALRPGGGYAILAYLPKSTASTHSYLIGVTAAGQLDPAWGDNGVTAIGDNNWSSLTSRPGGGYVVAFGNITNTQQTLVAYTDAGTLDTAWAASSATPGTLTVPLQVSSPVGVYNDGAGLLVYGNWQDDSHTYSRLLRLTAAGERDTSFSRDGQLELVDKLQVNEVTLRGGAYYLSGAASSGGMFGPSSFGGVAIAKLLGSGSLDPSFGSAGLTKSPLRTCDRYTHLFFDANHILASSRGECDQNDAASVTRFGLDGTVDRSYGHDGSVVLDTVGGVQAPYAVFTQLQGDGRLVGIGDDISAADGHAVLFRLGSTDPVALPGSFVPLPPARVLDTRNGTGVVAAGLINGGASIDLQVTGRGGIPASGVGAVVLNVTVTQPSGNGNVVVYPTGQPKPLASNLNFGPGLTIPNLVTVKVGTGGKVTLTNNQLPGDSLHLIADVAGYYLAGTAAQPGTYTPLVPARILDTRNGTGVVAAGLINGGASIDLQITGQGGIPASGVGAVVLNVTVTQPSGNGNVVAYPTGQPKPLASNLNFGPGQTIPNLVTVKVGTGGKVTLTNNQLPGDSLHLIADVAGYYLAGTATAKGTFVPVTPQRILDTRNGTGGTSAPLGAGSELQLSFTGPACCTGVPLISPVPSWWVSAVVMNVTVTQPTSDGNLVVYPTGTTPPLASNLNFQPGTTVPNLVIAKLDANRAIQIHNNAVQGTVHVIADVSGYFNS